MMIKVSVPNRFQLKTVSRFRTVLMPGQGEVHYIGGADILPPPLDSAEEGKMIALLGTEEDGKARSSLIEHNLRLVVYIAKKFDNTSVGVEDLISIGTIGLIKAIKANVLPVPVGALAMTSRHASSGGMASSCTRVGIATPFFSSARRISSLTPSS